MSSPPFSTAAVLPTELAFLSLFPQSDSESEEESSAPPKLSSKEERIQRAIDQGKASYNWDQAETKFGVGSARLEGCEARIEADLFFAVVRGRGDTGEEDC